MSSELKLLHLITSMDPATGGPCQGIRNSIPSMAELGVDSEVVCLESGKADDPFEVHSLGGGRTRWGYQPRLSAWLLDNLHRFDAVVANGLWQYPGLALRQAAARERKPYFIFPHGMLDPWFQRDPSRRWKAIRNWWYWKLIEARVIQDATGLLFTCEEEQRLAQRTFHPYRPQREFVVGYGIPEPPAATPSMKVRFRDSCPGLPPQQRYLLYLSRIDPKKGVDLLIRAYGEAYRIWRGAGRDTPHLVIAGPCANRRYWRQLQAAAEKVVGPDGSPLVHFPGQLRCESKWGAFYGADAFVLPSHQENFGIAVVEALACGVPVLITQKVNIWQEVVRDGAGCAARDTLDGIVSLLRDADRLPERIEPNAPADCFKRRFSNHSAASSLVTAIQDTLTDSRTSIGNAS